jgi:hypothetical protein
VYQNWGRCSPVHLGVMKFGRNSVLPDRDRRS